MSKKIKDLSELEGEVLAFVDVGKDDFKNDQIMLTTVSGKIIQIYHAQDCCENVEIEGIDGEWHTLIGKVLIEVEHEELESVSDDRYCESSTRTNLKFKVDGATVVSRWIGCSNGYYSESVDIKELTRPE